MMEVGASPLSPSKCRRKRTMRDTIVGLSLSTVTSRTHASPSTPARRSTAVRCSGSAMGMAAIQYLRRDQWRRDLHQFAITNRPEEAVPPPGVAGHTFLIDQQQQRVAIAIDTQLLQMLHLARCLSLPPECPAAAAEVAHATRGQCLRHGLAIHPCQHQHLAGVMLLRNGGNQAAAVEPDGFKDVVFAHACYFGVMTCAGKGAGQCQ